MHSLSKFLARFEFLYYRILSKAITSRLVDANGYKFSLVTSTANEMLRATTFLNKEPETVQWIDEFSSEAGNENFVFFDIGANVGIYSLYAASRYRNARVVSFEPDSQSFGSLCKNIFANKFSISPYAFAISDYCGVASVHLSSMNAGAGACALGENYQFVDTSQSNVFQQGVFVCSLDQLVSKFGFPIPNFIKIDVDGLEVSILRGSESVLRAHECKGLLVEFQYRDEKDLDPIMSYLGELGFALNLKSNWISEFGELKSRNFIFKRRK